MRRILRSPHILLANPPKKALTKDQVERRQEKAVDFLERVVGDEEVGQSGSTGLELADEISELSVEEYAERKGFTLENPSEHELIEQAVQRFLPLTVAREDRRSAVQAAREALGQLPKTAGEAARVAAVCEAVSEVADRVRERERQEEERQERQRGLDSRRSHRRWLIDEAKRHISSAYLYRLYSQGDVSREEWLRPDAGLLEDVEAGLGKELTGSESYEEARQLAEELADECLFDDEPEDVDGEDESGDSEEDDKEEADEEEDY